ncbi:MAG: hypothetical protein ACK4MQ_02385 [Hyphomonas sp.]
MKNRLRITISSLLLAAACATAPDASEPAAVARVAAGPPEVPAEGLPAQKLAPGECGLFLWGMSAPRRFVFFTEASSGEALILHDGSPRRLVVAEAGGEVFGQFFTESGYSAPGADWTVTLTLTPGELLEGGQRVRTGRLVTRGADGWETVLPVTGVRACMPG